MAIVIGNSDYRNKGYGTDALRLILQYGFCEPCEALGTHYHLGNTHRGSFHHLSLLGIIL